MNVFSGLSTILLLAITAHASANTCENNFLAEGDPRNGAEFSTNTTIAELTSASALGQLRAIALADGFTVLGEEATATEGTLTIEQKNGHHPFLIYLTAKNSNAAADVSIRTKLNRRTVAKPEDIRAGMCGMIARIKPGAAGEKIAAAARAAIVPEAIEEIQPRWLAQDIYFLSKRKTAEMITAHYKGKRYLLDGTVGEPLEPTGPWSFGTKSPSIVMGSCKLKLPISLFSGHPLCVGWQTNIMPAL